MAYNYGSNGGGSRYLERFEWPVTGLVAYSDIFVLGQLARSISDSFHEICLIIAANYTKRDKSLRAPGVSEKILNIRQVWKLRALIMDIV